MTVHRAGRDSELFGLLVDNVARLVDEQLIPAEVEAEEAEAIPPRIHRMLREFGLFGMAVPEEFGGLDFSMGEEVQVMFEFCRAAPAYRSLIGTTNGVGGKSIVLAGTGAQRERYLPQIARGDLIVSFCLTEPDAGSDARSLKTWARQCGDDYVINGTKRFISNAPEAGLFIVMARTDRDDTRASGISAFLVEAGTPGLSVGAPMKKMGHRAAHIADVVFEDCTVPATALLGGVEGLGFKTAMRVLDQGRVHIGAVAVGLGRRLIDESVEYAKSRFQFGKAIGEFQLVQAMLADSEAEWFAARSMVERAADRLDAGERITKEAASTKYFATEALWRIADRAVQIHGGYGYVADYPVERLFRDARLLRIFEGTSQIQQVVIAREMLREG